MQEQNLRRRAVKLIPCAGDPAESSVASFARAHQVSVPVLPDRSSGLLLFPLKRKGRLLGALITSLAIAALALALALWLAAPVAAESDEANATNGMQVTISPVRAEPYTSLRNH